MKMMVGPYIVRRIFKNVNFNELYIMTTFFTKHLDFIIPSQKCQNILMNKKWP